MSDPTPEAATPRPPAQFRRITVNKPVEYEITPAGHAALARDPNTDIRREPRRGPAPKKTAA